MFCPGCGTENPQQASFCLKCGSTLPRFTAGQAFVAPPPAFPGSAAPGAPAAQPSYLWGYIHGWVMLVGSPLLFLLFLAVLVAPESDKETRLGAIILMVLLAFSALTGFTLVRKSMLGMILTFVWTGLHLLFVGIFALAVVGQPNPPMLIGLLVVLVGLAFWIGCSIYYYRRRNIF